MFGVFLRLASYLDDNGSADDLQTAPPTTGTTERTLIGARRSGSTRSGAAALAGPALLMVFSKLNKYRIGQIATH
jgi:hypothetical protein